jgi:hypothetical protein
MSIEMTDERPDVNGQAAKEPKTIRVRLGTGPEWPCPVEIVKAMLESLSAANPKLVGQHLQAALMGQGTQR